MTPPPMPTVNLMQTFFLSRAPIGQSKRNLSSDEVENARKKVAADLQLEGEYFVAGEEGLSNGGYAGEGEEGGGGGGWSGGGGENGHANGSVRRKLVVPGWQI